MHDETDPLSEEEAAVELFRDGIYKAIQDGLPVAHWGDGNAGWMIGEFLSTLEEFGLYSKTAPAKPSKKKIPNWLRTAVFERDEYRCRHCGTHLNLRADHIIAESKGGETAIGNLQTLCLPCNSRKGVK